MPDMLESCKASSSSEFIGRRVSDNMLTIVADLEVSLEAAPFGHLGLKLQKPVSIMALWLLGTRATANSHLCGLVHCTCKHLLC